MRLENISIIVLAVSCFCWGASISEDLPTTPTPSEPDTADEIDSTTNSELYPDSGPECLTGPGEPGQCTTFQQCYPLTMTAMGMEKNSQNSSDSLAWTPLDSEIMSSSISPSCQNSTRICCKLDVEEDIEIWKDDNFETESSTNFPKKSDTPFPQDCGRSSVVTWRAGIAASWVTKGQKITGGRTAPQFQFPWMVAIFGKNGKITCGASLITRDFILTAGHCLAAYSATDLKSLKIHVGDHNLLSLKDGPHQVRRVSEAIIHPGFNSRNYHNDIALIKMDGPVSFSERIQPICLPRRDTNVSTLEGKGVIVAGWGRDRQWGYESVTLRMVEMPVWKFQDCARIYSTFAPNRVKAGLNLCAGDGKKNKDACIGDSGGPLMAEQGNALGSKAGSAPLVQLGIVSWGKGCGSFPGVYTNIATYVPWIEKHVANSRNKS